MEVFISKQTRTWHHGLVARWWAEFNQAGEDIQFFKNAVAGASGPVLDAGCGTGRILLPLLRAGVDADGADAANDMLKWCRQGAEAESLEVELYTQAMHELDLPRKYSTIVVCGAFGLGGSRAQDLQGLERIHQHLLPGGVLLLDHYLPNRESPRSWSAWVDEPELPRPWPRQGDRRVAADGSELELRVRQFAFDPLEQTTTLEIRASRYEDGEEVESEINAITLIYISKAD